MDTSVPLIAMAAVIRIFNRLLESSVLEERRSYVLLLAC